MGNVFRILLRDIKRLLKAPAALIVACALIVLPSLYTWYNVAAFWSPYEATGNLSVCVVNEDAGTSTDITGQLNVGDKITEELQANDQLNWTTNDLDTAMEDLKTGKVYAVYVIPEDFSACLVSPLTGDLKSPHIEYFANEKLGPVSPKITDAAANALDQKINSMFVSTVTEAATIAVDNAVKDAEADISAAKTRATDRADEAKAAVAEVREKLKGVVDTIGEARSKVATANEGISGASTINKDTQAVLKDVSDEAEALQASLSDISSKSVPELSNVLAELAQITAKAGKVASAIAASTGSVQADVNIAVAKIQPVVDAMRDTASDLETAASAISNEELSALLDQGAQDISERADGLQSTLDGIVSLADEAGNAAQTGTEIAEEMNEASAKAADSLSQFSDALHGSASSAIDASVAKVGSVCSKLSSAVSKLDAAVEQVRPTLDQLDGVLADSETAVTKTDKLIGDVQGDLDSVITDARLLAQSDVIANLLDNGTLNAQGISEFMGAPTELSTTKLYHPNAYGSAMAPLFMNLTFWIGAFMLVIIFLLEVDSEGIAGLKPWQRYLGRFFLFCIFAVLQAIVCCIGTLALGVQAANAPALFVASAVASLAYLSIIYALSATFRHVGKALCIVLVFAQIPGGSGLYPVEMTSSFFQAIAPFLPFTYGIDAMRESIGGFYGTLYAQDMLALGAFFVINLALGLILGPLMSNVVRMTSRQIHEGDLYNDEDVETPERPYRLAHMLRALAEKDSYREELTARYERFSRRYPIFIRGSIVLGVGVPVIVAALFTLDTVEKTALLTFLLVWLVLFLGFLVVMESQRYSFERQLNLEGMSEARLLNLFTQRDRMTRANFRVGLRGRAAADSEEPQSGLGKLHAAAHARRASGGGVRNIWLIARRDFSALFKNVMSVVITIGLVVLPSLFAWYNILACWNVFDNTSYLSVAVASEDEGFESDLMPMNVNVGDKVVSALRENEQIHWVFTDADEAVEGVKAGRYYASLVIPKDFSKRMLTFFKGDSSSATIDYYVNEKKNAIAPNITGTGADMVSYQVNATFADTISEVAVGIAQSLSKLAEENDVDGRVATLAEHMRKVASRLDQSADVLGLYSSLGRDSQGLVKTGAETVESARAKMQEAASDIDTDKKRLRKLADKMSNSIGKVHESLESAQSAVSGLEDRADAMVSNVAERVTGVSEQLRNKASELDAKAEDLSAALAALEDLREKLKDGVDTQLDIDISNGKANIKVDLEDGTVYQSDKALGENIDALSDTISSLKDAKDALEDAAADTSGDNSDLLNRISALDQKIDELSKTRAQLQEMRDNLVDVDVDVEAQLSSESKVLIENTIILDKDIKALQKAIEILQKASAACTKAADTLDAGTEDVEQKATALHEFATKARNDASAVKADLESDLEPGIDKLKSDVNKLIDDLKNGTDELRSLDPNLAETLESVASALGNASAQIDEANAKLHLAAKKVRSLANAVDAALTSGNTEKLRSLLQGSASDLAAALTAPVQIERTALFPSENFGSSMTPLYCTLALLIGSLLIMVAMKPEVSRRGREELVDPKPRHLYFGRFCAVGLVSLMQTTLLGLGTMLFLKVQMAEPLLFMLCFWLSGLIISFIVYTLVVAFGNLGKAIAVLLLIVQVTACGGSFPLQILPDFVQALSPWMPATYVVDGLRAAMMGVYLNDFWVSMGHLALFIIPFLLLGLVLRKPMESFMKFYVSKVEECGIMA